MWLVIFTHLSTNYHTDISESTMTSCKDRAGSGGIYEETIQNKYTQKCTYNTMHKSSICVLLYMYYINKQNKKRKNRTCTPSLFILIYIFI